MTKGTRFLRASLLRLLELLDTDEAGRVLLTVNEEYLFLWTGSNFRLILDPRIGLPGLKNGPFSTPLGYLSGEGTVLFGVIASGIGGIYHWRDGTVTAVAVDGDPSPVSDSLWVTNIREDIILLYRTVIRSFPSPVSPTEAVFSAGTAGPQSASVPMVWSAGRLTAINIGSGVSTRNSERLLEQLLPIGVDFAGRVLLRGVLCCSDNALYWAVPSAPRVHYLPFLAGGPLDDFRIASDVEISNESPFPAVLDAEFFDSEGFLLSRSRHGLVLPARSTMTLDPGARELFSGYARITIENGAEVAASNSLRLSHSGVGSLSQVTIPPLGPSSRFDVIVQESVRTHMALALTNQHQTPLSIELSLLEADGTDIDQETVDLAGGQQSAFFLGDRMALPEVDFSGRLLLRSDKPFLLEVFSQSGSKLAHLPLFTKPASDPEWGFVPMFPLALDEDELLRGFSFENQVFQSNKSGTIAFPFQEGLWVADPQSGDQILPTSSFPSGDAGQSFPGLRVLAVNEAGDVLFSTQASNTVELMLWEDGSLREIYQGSRPGFDDVRKVLSPSGAVALARLPNGDLLLIDESVERIVRAGDPLPGGSGETWGPIGSTPVFNSNDDLLFGGVLAVGLFSGGEVQLLVRTEELPGVPATAEFVAPFLVGLSDSGEAFVGASWELSDSDFEIALYVISDDEILPLVLPADPFPGSPETDILGLGGKRVVFSSEAGAGVAQLRVRTSDSQELDAFVRFTANGLEPLVVVDTPEIYEILDFDANSRGDLGFWARDPYNSQSLWFAGLEGLQRLLGEGTRLDGEATSPPGFIRRVIGRPRVFESGDFASYMEVAGGRTNGIYLGQARTSRLYLPLVVAGTFGSLNYESRVLLSNPGIRDTTVEFDLTDMTGDPVTSAPPVILPAGQTRTVEIDSHANLIGWLELRITGQLQALLHLSVLRGNSLESELYMQPSSLERNLAFRVSLDDALTVANPYPRGINVVLEFRDSEGSLLSQSLSVPPNGQMNWLRSPGHLPEIRSTQTVNVSSAVPVPLLPLHMRASGLSVAPAW